MRRPSPTLERVKQQTWSFYEALVRDAVTRVVHSLDDALHLHELAHASGLSPLHFHRIFRSMVGETPLELHRRLRLERAAWRLAHSDARVTSVAFEAGYETHESFTRSFRDAYSASPSEFRVLGKRAHEIGAPGPHIELGAPCGVHFSDPAGAEPVFLLHRDRLPMDVVVEELPERRAVTVPHVGPYIRIGTAFQRLWSLARSCGLTRVRGPEFVAIYHDDFDLTPLSELRSEAGLLIPDRVRIPDTLVERRIPAGRYARTTHVGAYNHLGDSWTRLLGGWLPQSGERARDGMMYDLYCNTPMNCGTDALRTDLYLPIA